MKKIIIVALAATALIGTASFAEESYVTGGFEASGHIVAGAGWQRYKVPTAVGSATSVARDVNGTIPGAIGNYVVTPTAANASTAVDLINREDNFRFFVDEFELDLAKTLGENIRIRADLDFGGNTLNGGPRFQNANGAGGSGNVLIEQAYATANIAIGNGLEVLLGRFDIPIGFEKVDVTANDTISRSAIYRALRPNIFTGGKIYYAFSDLVDFNLYLANQILSYNNGGNAFFQSNADIPNVGLRLGFNWGEEGKKSTIGLSGIWGQDHPNIKKHQSFLGDIDWQWWATDNFAFGGEAIYRQINTTVVGQRNGKYYAGLINLRYDFSDVWDGTLKYAYSRDVNGVNSTGSLVTAAYAPGVSTPGTAVQSLLGRKSQAHEITLAGNYTITDGAKLKLEGDYSLVRLPGTTNKSQHIFGLAGAFAYEF
ncbi:MAG: hypothetical protein A3H42_05320 [Deltaproteobacteria bacterium RIFCSPLOWO2_02_FULL_46_8]|nr:MAG: hypothetical protein A3H42_05320 [Deltaproteobacteria bacterium RIFCSPLOWO2_02_FULL_46_8]